MPRVVFAMPIITKKYLQLFATAFSDTLNEGFANGDAIFKIHCVFNAGPEHLKFLRVQLFVLYVSFVLCFHLFVFRVL